MDRFIDRKENTQKVLEENLKSNMDRFIAPNHQSSKKKL